MIRAAIGNGAKEGWAVGVSERRCAADSGAFGRVGRVLSTIAILGLSLSLVTAPAASASPVRHDARSSPARARALADYRRVRALQRHGQHERRGGVPRARTAVVGGTLASIEEVPWQVAIFGEFEVGGLQFSSLCGGSIIDLSHVLTAGHCAVNPATGLPLSAASFDVVAGASIITPKGIKEGPTVQARFVGGVRVHPDFDYAAGPPDDVAVLTLAEPLKASSAVQSIGLPTSTASPAEGTDAVLSGYGEENPITEELNEKLYSLPTVLGFPRECGGEADALILCGSSSGGSACSGDNGGGVVAGHTLIGVIDTVEFSGGELCSHGAIDGFVNVAAPEIHDFIEGSEDPPLAPRGGGVAIEGVPEAGYTLSCEPGGWSHDPSFSYAFINSADQQVLQRGSLSTYALSAADVGRTIFCEVEASNAGGTGVARTGPLPPVKAAPPSGGGSSSGGDSTASSLTASSTATGGVLGSTSTSISSAQIATLLERELTPGGNAAKVATLLKTGGFTITFKALEAGTAVIDRYQVPPAATLAKKSKAKPILVASGRATFSAAGTAKIEIKLTAAGKHLLKSNKRLKLTAKGIFTPTGKRTVIATKAFVVGG